MILGNAPTKGEGMQLEGLGVGRVTEDHRSTLL